MLFLFPYSIQIAWCPTQIVLFSFLASAYVKQDDRERERENGDHHIIFVVTIRVEWEYTRFSCRPTYIVRSPSSLTVSYYSFFAFDMRKKSRSYHFSCILDWLFVIQGCIMFSLTNYSVLLNERIYDGFFFHWTWTEFIIVALFTSYF
jgi:hypothetical protein